ncbi:MAG: hypothetical protein MUF49_02410 [Oculatellaceae cyanobacterium Prado106]|nr:hypothetical protein [Oculatellaceae cyanobacterium Prado106]
MQYTRLHPYIFGLWQERHFATFNLCDRIFDLGDRTDDRTIVVLTSCSA